MCTRCVRFLDEVPGTSELGVFGRGSKEVIDIAPGHEVDNDYDVNIVDICPVGALTDRDFRFRVRSWYLTTQPSVCDGCSTGCSILVDYNKKKPYKNEGRRIVRFRARKAEPNGHWICNHGRYTYKKFEENRLLVPRVHPESGWPDSYDAALTRLAQSLGEDHEASSGGSIGVIVAPGISNEEAFVLRALFVDGLRTPHVDHRIPGLVAGAEPGEPPVDGLLRRKDPWPNSRGLTELGLLPGEGGHDVAGMVAAAASGEISTLIIVGADLTTSSLDRELLGRALQRATSVALVTHRSDMNALVDVALPMASSMEQTGTWTNHEGRVQRFMPVLERMGEARPLLEVLASLAEGTGVKLPATSPADAFARLTGSFAPARGLSFEALEPVDRTDDTHSQWINSLIVPQL